MIGRGLATAWRRFIAVKRFANPVEDAKEIMDLADWERKQTCQNKQEIREIRKIMHEHAKINPNLTFHVTSYLNWLRYIKQVRYLEDIILPQSEVLDLGCGLGHTTALLASFRKDIKILGADMREHMTWTKLRKYGCKFCMCDATALPFLSESFDVIVSFGVMEHADSDLAFLKEIHRCLRSGGLNIVFQLPNKYSLSEYLSKRMGLWHHERTYTLHDIKNLTDICGFEIDNISREHVIPAQVNRISHSLEAIFDKNHHGIYRLDKLLCKTPLTLISQDYMIVTRKT
jgi:2-polyprenyl-3-methyl-5-hydroxy-6-metoxy-1,4-benzoquinol methylase